MPNQNMGGFAAIGTDLDEAERRIQEWAQGFADKAQRYQEVREQTAQLRLTATSSDGRIKVTVGADGGVTDLAFTDKVRSMPPSELATQILSTMHRAQADIATRISETMTAHLGEEDLQTRSMVLDNLRERFPEQPEEPESEPETSSHWDLPEEADETATPSAPAPPGAQPGGPGADNEDGEFGSDFDPLRD